MWVDYMNSFYVRKSDCDGDVANLTARNSILGVFPLQINVT